MSKLISTTQSVFRDTDASKVGDLVSGSANATTFYADGIKHMMQMSAIAAKNVGYNFEETMIATGAMNRAGITSGEMAGTLFRTAVPDLNPNTKPAEQAFSKYGLYDENGRSKFYNEQGSLRKPQEISALLAKQFKGVRDDDRDSAFQDIAGDRGKMMLASYFDLGQNNNQGMNEYVSDVKAKTAEQSADDRNSSPQARLRNLQNALTTSATEAFYGAVNSLGPVLDRATEYFVKFLPQITQFGKDFGTGVKDYFNNLFNTDAWQEAKTPGEKIKVFVESITTEVGSAFSEWFNGGGKEKIASGLVAGLSTLGEVAMDVGGQLVSTAWDLLVESMKQGFKEDPALTIGLGVFALFATGGLVAVGLANLVLFAKDIKNVLSGFPNTPKIGKGGKGGLGSGLGGCCCGGVGGGVDIDKNGNPKKTTTKKGNVSKGFKTAVDIAKKNANLLITAAVATGVAIKKFGKNPIKTTKAVLPKIVKVAKGLQNANKVSKLGLPGKIVGGAMVASTVASAFTKDATGPKKGKVYGKAPMDYGNPLEWGKSNENLYTKQLIEKYKEARKDGDSLTVQGTVSQLVAIAKDAQVNKNTEIINMVNKAMNNNETLSADIQGVDASIKPTPLPVGKIQEFFLGISNWNTTVAEIANSPLTTGVSMISGINFSGILGGLTTSVNLLSSNLMTDIETFVMNFGAQAAAATAGGGPVTISLAAVGIAAAARDVKVGDMARNAAVSAIANFPMPAFNFNFGGILGHLVSRIAGAARSAASNSIASTSAPSSPGPNKSRSGGEYRVPADGVRLVHRDETILPRGEARAYRNGSGSGGGGAIISGNTFHVREEADVQKVARQIARELLQG
jgi:TP901 family phage tail tape measure protein